MELERARGRCRICGHSFAEASMARHASTCRGKARALWTGGERQRAVGAVEPDPAVGGPGGHITLP